MTHTRETFFCYAFGRKIDGIYVTANSVKSARDLAAYRLRVHRSAVSVQHLPDDAQSFWSTHTNTI